MIDYKERHQGYLIFISINITDGNYSKIIMYDIFHIEIIIFIIVCINIYTGIQLYENKNIMQ